MKKNKLLIDYDFGFILIGIITTNKEYKLAWILSKRLHIDLAKQKDIEINFNDGNILLLSNFTFASENASLTLFRNKVVEGKGKQQYLLPELSHMDYFIKVEGEGESFEIELIIEILKTEPTVQLVQLLQVDQIRNKENLIF